MSKDNPGRKETIILRFFLIEGERYDLVVKPHKQTIGYFRSKRQTRNKTIIAKPKLFITRRFSKTRKAVLESDTTTIKKFQDLKDSIEKNNPIDRQNQFFDSKSTSPSSKKGKRRFKKLYTNKPVRLYNWN